MKFHRREPFVSFSCSFAGKCKDEGSSGGGDDAAELGIGATLKFIFLPFAAAALFSNYSKRRWRLPRSRIRMSVCTHRRHCGVPLECEESRSGREGRNA